MLTQSTTRSLIAGLLSLLLLLAFTPQYAPANQSAAVQVLKVVGEMHKLALLSDGRVVGWRGFQHGQLGPVSGLPLQQMYTSQYVNQQLPGKAIDVAAGDSTSYILLADGSVWAYGRGDSGELGTGPNPDQPLLASSTRAMEYRGAERPVPVRISGVIRIAAAGNAAFAVMRDGSVRSWGARNAGLLGDGTSEVAAAFQPVKVVGATGVTKLSASRSHVLAITNDGRVLSWGSNTYGALGREQDARIAAEVPGLTGVVSIAAGMHVSTAVKSDGTVWVWGMNGHGQLGNGKRGSNYDDGVVRAPQRLGAVANAIAVTSGFVGRHTIVLLKDGTLRGWGNTDWGQLGAGVSGTFQLSPVTPRIANVKLVFAIGNNTFAVKTDGTFWGWGTGDRNGWPFQVNMKIPTAIELN